MQRGRLPGDRYIRRPRAVRGLRHVLGVPGLFSTAYGNVGSSIYYALGVTALYALGLTPVIFILGGLLFACTALSYAEGATAIPEAGGSSAFARRGFNDFWGFVAGWALTLDYIITIAISAFAVPNYLAFFYAPLKTWPINSAFGIAIVLGLAAINIIGIRESARVNILLAILDLMTQGLIVMLGLFLLLNVDVLLTNVQWGVAPTWNQLLFGFSISMVAYTGIETISNLGEETRLPGLNIPRAMLLVLATVIIMYALIPSIALSSMPVELGPQGTWTSELGERWVQDPVMGIVSHMPAMLRPLLGAWVGILAATILIIAANAGIMGLSRLSYSMGRHHLLPAVLSRIDEKRHTPTMAIIIFSLMASLLILPGRVELLADLYSFGAMLAYTFAHASILALRFKEPTMPRPFRIPFNISIKGRLVPLPALVGGAGTFGTWLVVIWSHELGRVVGFVWLMIGVATYIFYRRRAGIPLLHFSEPQAKTAG